MKRVLSALGRVNRRSYIAIGLIVLIIASVAGAIRDFNKPAPPEPPKSAMEIMADENFDLILQAQVDVSRYLKDPASAKFGNLFVSRRTGAPVVCGSVSSKNSFGAYTGQTPFFIERSTIHMPDSAPPSEFARRWRESCAN